MIIKHINDIIAKPSSHGCGEKLVLTSNEETVSAITQIAETTLHKGEVADIHSHETMEEFFYILDGEVEMVSEGITAICKKGDFISIKPKERHGLKAATECRLLTIGCAAKLP